MSEPTIVATIEQLRRHMIKQGYSNTTLATDLELFGGSWEVSYVASLMAGSKKLTEQQNEFIVAYLLQRFMDYNNDLVAE